MSIFNSTITQFRNGKCSAVGCHVDFDDPDMTLEILLEEMHMVLYKNDASIVRMIPECLDGERLVFLDEIGEGIYAPNIQDIERCYYDDVGMPEHIQNYYSGICVFDTDTVKSGTFQEVLKNNFSSIKTIV